MKTCLQDNPVEFYRKAFNIFNAENEPVSYLHLPDILEKKLVHLLLLVSLFLYFQLGRYASGTSQGRLHYSLVRQLILLMALQFPQHKM